ncbi:STAS domain-containing protein [Neptunicella marina]|uniref:STAS domain-containing protein n=1 Tax=Neptunicella marina TaxID=2125989 RepID=A0A8J6IT83_9ALTE|nr:STAS domain-containing protein [Neptunicella marina]MBC3765452.1 STAS domain-containing protein [Neptunicella marina]
MSEVVMPLPEKFDFGFNKEFMQQYQSGLSREGVTRIVLDFNRVTYLDSSALGMMVLLQKRAKEKNIRAVVRCAKGTANEVLKMANFQKLFDFE